MSTKATPMISAPIIDDHALEYLELKILGDAAKDRLDDKKQDLVKLVTKNGGTPAGAEKSLRLEGDKYQLTVSFGTSSSIDKDVVGKIQAELAEQHTPGLFKQMFQAHVDYVVAPTAQVVLETASAKLRALFARVMKTKPKEPSLKVEKKK
jgi:hypothetical protein